MRIVGGELRGRNILAPKSQAIRPTTDRIRESLFNIMEHSYGDDLEQARVLDLFAGTGALGLEALSRGAQSTVFIENSIEGRGLLRQNIEAFSLQGKTKVYRRDATRLGEMEKVGPFNLVFADPPYGHGFGEKAAASALDGGWLAENALFVLEEERASAPSRIDGFEQLDSRSYAGTTIGFFRLKA